MINSIVSVLIRSFFLRRTAFHKSSTSEIHYGHVRSNIIITISLRFAISAKKSSSYICSSSLIEKSVICDSPDIHSSLADRNKTFTRCFLLSSTIVSTPDLTLAQKHRRNFHFSADECENSEGQTSRLSNKK